MALTIYFKVLTKFFLCSSYAIVCLGLCRFVFFLFCEKKVLFFLVLVSYMSAELNGLLVLIILMAKFFIASYLVCLLDSMTWFNCSAITLALVYICITSKHNFAVSVGFISEKFNIFLDRYRDMVYVSAKISHKNSLKPLWYTEATQQMGASYPLQPAPAPCTYQMQNNEYSSL